MRYDIRDKYKAAKTLERLTGVRQQRWLQEIQLNSNRSDYSNEDKDIERIIYENNGHFPSLNDIDLVVTHITTCSDNCQSIKKNGIINLKKSYLLLSSDLRKFLDKNGIEIVLDSCILKYQGKEYDIDYRRICCYDYDSIEHRAKLVGRKFYFDYTVCGFLSISRRDIYRGDVHLRPEILSEIDYLLGTNLQSLWLETHMPYQVVFVLPEYDSVYNGFDEDDEYQRVMYYLIEAYNCICLEPKTTTILCKNSIDILPNQILECNKFDMWQ